MTEKEKALVGIKCCLSDHACIGCPYDDVDSSYEDCTFNLYQNLVELLTLEPQPEEDANHGTTD